MSAVGIRRLLAGLLAVAVAGAWLTGGSSASQPPEAEPRSGAFATVDPLAAPVAGPLIERARELLGERFGGAWIDRRGARPRLVVSTTGDPAAAAPRLNPAAAKGPSIEVVAAPASSAELDRARRAATRLLGRRAATFFVEPDPASGALVVGGPDVDRATRAAIERRAGEVAVRFEPGELGFRRDAACPACYPPFKGGLLLRIGPAVCTSGLTMKRRHRGRTTYVGVTAGHCRANRKDKVFIGGKKVGTVNANAYRCCRRVKADALRFPVRRSAARPRVYIPLLGVDAPVRGKLSDRLMVPGTSICFVGVSSGGACGVVTRTKLAIRSGRKFQLGLWCISVPAIPGDSGGSVIQPQAAGALRAAGVVSGTLTTDTSQEMCFSTTSRISKRLGVRLVNQRGG